MTQKPRKGNFVELKSKTIPGGAWPQISQDTLARLAFVASEISHHLSWLYRSVPDNCIKRSALPDLHQLKTSSEDDVFSKPKMRQKCT